MYMYTNNPQNFIFSFIYVNYKSSLLFFYYGALSVPVDHKITSPMSRYMSLAYWSMLFTKNIDRQFKVMHECINYTTEESWRGELGAEPWGILFQTSLGDTVRSRCLTGAVLPVSKCYLWCHSTQLFDNKLHCTE